MIHGKRLDVVLKLSNYSYDTFVKKCEELDVSPLPLNEYAHKLGLFIISRDTYGSKSPQESYLKVVSDTNKEAEQYKTLGKDRTKASGCGGKKKKPPNIAKKGFNFAKALTEHIITGKKHVPRSVTLQRLTKCASCTSIREGFVCNECGCYMGIKASWAEQKCKLNKW